jgi:hypothetical protein
MNQKWIARIVIVAVLAILALWIKSYFSAANVVKRSLFAAVESFEQEQIIGSIQPISRSYDDRWGMSYESIAGNLRSAMDTYDDLQIDLEPLDIRVEGDEVRVGMRFVMWGTYDGTKGYVIGSVADPCTATQVWRKEPAGWRVATTEKLDIPELREELEEMAEE